MIRLMAATGWGAGAPTAQPPGLRVLMVAEKPSIAAALAAALAEGCSPSKRKSVVPGASPPVFEYDARFHALGSVPAHFKVTSTVGHMFSLDFPVEYNNTQQVKPADLFRAPTVHMEDPRPRVSEHLGQEVCVCVCVCARALRCDAVRCGAVCLLQGHSLSVLLCAGTGLRRARALA